MENRILISIRKELEQAESKFIEEFIHKIYPEQPEDKESLESLKVLLGAAWANGAMWTASKLLSSDQSSDESIIDLSKVQYLFYQSEYIKEIICKISPEEYDNEKPEYENAVVFFNNHRNESHFIGRLYNTLKEFN